MAGELKNIKVEYSCETTVNIGDFQNVKPGYRVTADVVEGVHPNVARDKLKTLVDAWLEADVEKIREEMNA